MKIWLIHQHAGTPSQVGGYVRHFHLARNLIDAGHDVTIIASSFAHKVRKDLRLEKGEISRYVVEDGVPFYWVKAPVYGAGNARRLWNLIAFGKRIKNDRMLRELPKPDVIVGSSPSPFTAFAAMQLAQCLQVPFVLEVRDLWPETLIELGGMSRWNPLVMILSRMERTMFREATAIISALPNLDGYIKEFGLPHNNISWIPNGIYLKSLPSIASPDQKDYFDIVYAGAHGIANNLDTIIDAAHYLNDRIDIRFRLIGDGPHKKALMDRVKSQALNNVIFEDAVPHSEIHTKLAAAHAFIFTLADKKLWRFGISPNKVFDYLAMARPTVSTVSAYNDPFGEAGAGITVPAASKGSELAEAIKKVADMSAEERWEMGKRGRAYVEANHSYEVLSNKLAEALSGAITTYRTGRKN